MGFFTRIKQRFKKKEKVEVPKERKTEKVTAPKWADIEFGKVSTELKRIKNNTDKIPSIKKDTGKISGLEKIVSEWISTGQRSGQVSSRIDLLHKRIDQTASSIIRKQIQTLLENNPNQTFSELQSSVGLKKQTLSYHLDVLLKANAITKQRMGKHTYYMVLAKPIQ